MAPFSNLSMDREIMDPSPISPNSSRHGRRASVAKIGKTRGRGYSVVDERESLIAKALTWELKRTVKSGEEQEEDEEKLVADAEGWVDSEDLLARPQLSALSVSLSELQTLIASPTSKAKFSIKSSFPTSHQIRLTPSATRPTSPTTSAPKNLSTLSTTTEDLPETIIYETSYANYPLILAAESIKRAGGQSSLSFTTFDPSSPSDADISIHIDLRKAMEGDEQITWSRDSETGKIVTEGDKKGSVSKKWWTKVVARRADIGVLYEDGEVRKEIPVGLRGKGAKPKKGGKGRGKGAVAKAESGSGSE